MVEYFFCKLHGVTICSSINPNRQIFSDEGSCYISVTHFWEKKERTQPKKGPTQTTSPGWLLWGSYSPCRQNKFQQPLMTDLSLAKWRYEYLAKWRYECVNVYVHRYLLLFFCLHCKIVCTARWKIVRHHLKLTSIPQRQRWRLIEAKIVHRSMIAWHHRGDSRQHLSKEVEGLNELEDRWRNLMVWPEWQIECPQVHGALASDDDGARSIGAVPNPSFDQLARECDCQLISSLA